MCQTFSQLQFVMLMNMGFYKNYCRITAKERPTLHHFYEVHRLIDS